MLLLRVPLSLLVDDEVVVIPLLDVVVGAVVGAVLDLVLGPGLDMVRGGRLERALACALAAANVLARLPPVRPEPSGVVPWLDRRSAMILARNFVCSQQEKGSSRSAGRTPLLTPEPLLAALSMQTRQPST